MRLDAFRTAPAAALAMLLAAPGAAAQGRAKKVLRVGITAPPASLDPSQALDTVSGLVCNQVFETPYTLLPGSTTTTPRLFAGALRADGPATYSAAIRNGATFSDGSPVSAAAAAASLSRVKTLTERGTVKAEGNRVVFTLKAPDALLETTLSQTFCGVAVRKGGAWIGSGPYMASPSSTLNSMTLVRNPKYAPAAPIEEIRFLVFRPTADGGVSGLVNAVRRGDVDFTDGIPAADVASLEKTPGLVASVTPGKSTGILFFQTERPALQDPRVRLAIARAIDTEEISKRFFGGVGTYAASGLLPPAMGTKEPPRPAFDPAAARALLAETKAPVELELVETWTSRPYAPNPTGICRLIADQLAKVGLEVRVTPPGGTAGYYARVEKGDFDMILSGWVADTHEPIDFLESELASWAIPTPGNRCGLCHNYSRYRSKAVDGAVRAYRESRKPAALQAIFDAMRDDVPFVPLAHGPSAIVLSSKVRGWKASPLAGIQFASFQLD